VRRGEGTIWNAWEPSARGVWVCEVVLGRRQPGLPGWQVLRYAEAEGHDLEGVAT
jgi:hypothetical protein